MQKVIVEKPRETTVELEGSSSVAAEVGGDGALGCESAKPLTPEESKSADVEPTKLSESTPCEVATTSAADEKPSRFANALQCRNVPMKNLKV